MYVYTHIPLPGKSNFSYQVTILKCQKLPECHVHNCYSIYINEIQLFYAYHYYCFIYLQSNYNNYNNPLVFVVWPIVRDSGFMTGNNLIPHTAKL